MGCFYRYLFGALHEFIHSRCDSCIDKGLTADNDDGANAAKPTRNHDCTCHQIQKVTFKDSARFLSAPLGKLTTNLRSRARPDSCENCDEEGFCSSCAEKDDLKDVF